MAWPITWPPNTRGQRDGGLTPLNRLTSITSRSSSASRSIGALVIATNPYFGRYGASEPRWQEARQRRPRDKRRASAVLATRGAPAPSSQQEARQRRPRNKRRASA